MEPFNLLGRSFRPHKAYSPTWITFCT